MSQFDPRASSPSSQLVAMLLVVVVAASVGFGLGREAGGSQAGSFGVAIAPSRPAVAHAAFAVHDDSIPDTADTLRHESLRDDDVTPTF